MKKILTLLIVLMLSTPLLAQDDSTAVNMAQVLDRLGNRALDGLDELAGQMGITAEKAFPYAMQYVGAKRSVEWWVSIIVSSLTLILFIAGITFMMVCWKSVIYPKDWEPGTIIALVFLGIFTLVTSICSFSSGIDYYIYKLAPEAATVEYLINMAR